jgi:DNA invertase Pin-like site-specific DNA recombinase
MVKSSESQKRVSLYLRCSTQDQSTELQKNELLAYIKARGWTLHEIFEDHGKTGTNGDRPALKRLMKDARQRKFDIVCCYKLDRFFRSLSAMVAALQEFSDLGIQFVSQKDQIDLTTSSGRLLMHLLASFAEFEASLIKERVVAGIANARRKGIKLGRPKQRNDEDILRLRREGQTIRAIALQLKISKGSVQTALNTAR